MVPNQWQCKVCLNFVAASTNGITCHVGRMHGLVFNYSKYLLDESGQGGGGDDIPVGKHETGNDASSNGSDNDTPDGNLLEHSKVEISLGELDHPKESQRKECEHIVVSPVVAIAGKISGNDSEVDEHDQQEVRASKAHQKQVAVSDSLNADIMDSKEPSPRHDQGELTQFSDPEHKSPTEVVSPVDNSPSNEPQGVNLEKTSLTPLGSKGKLSPYTQLDCVGIVGQVNNRKDEPNDDIGSSDPRDNNKFSQIVIPDPKHNPPTEVASTVSTNPSNEPQGINLRMATPLSCQGELSQTTRIYYH